MTISVKITNESQLYDMHARNIEVVDGAGNTHLVAPEQSVSVHVWLGTQITITEKELPESRGHGALPPQSMNVD